jgi:hypothetical protein
VAVIGLTNGQKEVLGRMRVGRTSTVAQLALGPRGSQFRVRLAIAALRNKGLVDQGQEYDQHIMNAKGRQWLEAASRQGDGWVATID